MASRYDEVYRRSLADAIKGEEPVAFAVLEPGHEPSGHLRVEIKNVVRQSLGAFAAPRVIRFVAKLPRTKRGGYMRNLLRALHERLDPTGLDVEEESASPAEVRAAFREMRQLLE